MARATVGLTPLGALVCLVGTTGTLTVISFVSPSAVGRLMATGATAAVVLVALSLVVRALTPERATGLGLAVLITATTAMLVKDALTLTALTPTDESRFTWIAAALPVIAVSAHAATTGSRARAVTVLTALSWLIVVGVGTTIAGVPVGDTDLGEAFVVGAVGLFAGVAIDVVASSNRSAQLRAARASEEARWASLDHLTGLPNRRGVQGALAELTTTGGAVALLDIDHFKAVNDQHGHAVGDAVLSRAGRRLAAAVRHGDTAARWGGEEFVLVLPGASLSGAVGVAERVRATVETLRDPVHVTASIGLATVAPGQDADRALRDADDALYAAKTGGRNRVAVVDGGDVRVLAERSPDRRRADDVVRGHA